MSVTGNRFIFVRLIWKKRASRQKPPCWY